LESLRRHRKASDYLGKTYGEQEKPKKTWERPTEKPKEQKEISKINNNLKN